MEEILNKEITGISKGTMEEDPEENDGNEQGNNGRGLNKKIEATSKGMKRRINRIWK